MDNEERSTYENSLKYYRDMNNVLATAKGEGWAEGNIEMAQSAVIEVLEVKFSNIPYSIKEKILYCHDLEKLRQAHRNAILLNDINKFKI